MSAVTKRLVGGVSASAQGGLLARPGRSTARCNDRQISLHHDGAVLDRSHFERAALLVRPRTGVADGAIVAEARLLVAVVTEWLVLRFATSAKRGTIFQTGDVIRCAVDIELTGNKQGTVVSNINCIGLLIQIGW